MLKFNTSQSTLRSFSLKVMSIVPSQIAVSVIVSFLFSHNTGTTRQTHPRFSLLRLLSMRHLSILLAVVWILQRWHVHPNLANKPVHYVMTLIYAHIKTARQLVQIDMCLCYFLLKNYILNNFQNMLMVFWEVNILIAVNVKICINPCL